MSSRSGAASAAAAGLGHFFGIAAETGLDAALAELELEELVGRPVVEVVAGIVDALAGSGEDLEGQAARSALCDVFEELIGDAELYAELADALPDMADIAAILCSFITRYLYLLLLPVVDERIERLADDGLRPRRERELREVIEACVEATFPCADTDSSVWLELTTKEVRKLLRKALACLEGQCT